MTAQPLALTRRKPRIYGFHGFWCVSSEAPNRTIRAFHTWDEALGSVGIALPARWWE